MTERHHLEFDAPVGHRLHKRFWGITNNSADLWWSLDERRWMPYEQGKSLSNMAHCRSVRAFKRHLRRHPELAGSEVTLVSRFVGFDIVAVPHHD